MYQTAAALKRFFSGFGYPAFAEDTVPEGVQPPYITYSISIPEWNQKASGYARVWDRTKSNETITRIADQITAAIGEGKKIPFTGGYLVIWPETPAVQIQTDEDWRYAYINYSINSHNMPGV